MSPSVSHLFRTLFFGVVLVLIGPACGSGGSNGSDLATPPIITSQPSNQSVIEGQQARFQVTAQPGNPGHPIGYQWRVNRNGIFVPATLADGSGATTPEFITLPLTLVADGILVDCLVADQVTGQQAQSTSASLKVSPQGPSPTILIPPAGAAVKLGQIVTLSVQASGSAPLRYQWRRNGIDLAGATSPSLKLVAADLTEAGTFDVVVSNSIGTATSSTAQVLVDIPIPSYAKGFEIAGDLAMGRHNHTATLLPNGQVLIVGGRSDGNIGTLASAEVYDPVTRRFNPTGDLNVTRFGHTATLLSDGRVLITGGFNQTTRLSSAEVYDPASGRFSSTGAMGGYKAGHSATRLYNGKVLVVGHEPVCAELYDPERGSFSTAVMGAYSHSRIGLTSTLLPDGRVLVSGGTFYHGGDHSAEIYDPVSDRFSEVPSMAAGRFAYPAVLLSDGSVLLAVGLFDQLGNALASCERYLPGPNGFISTGSLQTSRGYATATLLPTGKVLISGGYNPIDFNLNSAELFDPSQGLWRSAGTMVIRRENHTANLLPDGTVLIVGGWGSAPIRTCELFQ